MTTWDWLALSLFAVCWLGYQPLLGRVSRSAGAISTDMSVIRDAWMRAMLNREVRITDSQLMGHVVNSASFFASANLLLIAAAAGALFGGDAIRHVASLSLVETTGTREMLELKLALVVVTLVRGFLDFIWAIRQLNYTLGLIGAAPEICPPAVKAAYAEAAAAVLTPALSAFSRGARGYYFALAAAAWLFGPIWFAAATAGFTVLLIWRQSRSPAARALRRARTLLETTAAEPAPSHPRKARTAGDA